MLHGTHFLYADTEIGDHQRETLHVVPEEEQPIFGYALRCAIVSAISDMHHWGYVHFGYDARNADEAMWERIFPCAA